VTNDLTPNRNGRPANLSLEEFLIVMNTGADLKNRPPFVPSPGNDLLQIMPWPVFSKMTDRALDGRRPRQEPVVTSASVFHLDLTG